MVNVLRYILTKNRGLDKFKYFLSGTAFQLYKRITGKGYKIRLFNGKTLQLWAKCNISSLYAYTEIPDEAEIETLRRIISLSAQPHFLDIGANIGSYSVCVMDICPKIDAFEPHPFTHKRISENFRLNNYDSTHAHQIALSNKTGKIAFSDLGSSSAENHIVESGGIEVRVATLDHIASELRFSKDDDYIIKVDVEGFEAPVFEGAEEFFKAFKVAGLLFESFAPERPFAILQAAGFKSIIEVGPNNYLATKNAGTT